MVFVRLLFLFLSGAAVLGAGLFLLASIRERKARAAFGAGGLLIVFSILLVLGGFLYPQARVFQAAFSSGAAVFILLFYLPLSPAKPLRPVALSKRVDERDVIFAREEYLSGTEKHAQYYASRPENLEKDERLRRLPPLLAPGGCLYDPALSPRINALFGVIEELTRQVDGVVSSQRIEAEPREMTRAVKDLVLRLGASEVGIAELNPQYVYSHVGRGPEPWGSPIENNHRFAVAFTLEMEYFAVETAPRPRITLETAVKYLLGGQISIALARWIRALGFPARAHMAGSNYQIMLPPVAQDAGLGELGRMGYLISPTYGPRIRLGAITTDLPLIPDKPVVFGVQDFCKKCLKCAKNCPSGAISRAPGPGPGDGGRWRIDVERCLGFWRITGSDCGLCMKVCPYSHPPTLAHNLVRAGIRRSGSARRLARWGEDLFYGQLRN